MSVRDNRGLRFAIAFLLVALHTAALGAIARLARRQVSAKVVRSTSPAATYAIGFLAAFWFFERLTRFWTRAAMRFTGGTKMTSALKLGLFAVVAAIATLSASPATADVKPWDQAGVTAIAQKLVPASDAFWQAMRRQPGDTVGSGDAGANVDLQSKSRTLTEMTQGLAGQLAKGKGHHETLDMYKSMKELVDDITNDAMFDSLDAPTNTAWTNFANLLKQIAPYYDARAPGDMSDMK